MGSSASISLGFVIKALAMATPAAPLRRAALACQGPVSHAQPVEQLLRLPPRGPRQLSLVEQRLCDVVQRVEVRKQVRVWKMKDTVCCLSDTSSGPVTWLPCGRRAPPTRQMLHERAQALQHCGLSRPARTDHSHCLALSDGDAEPPQATTLPSSAFDS